MKPIEEQFEDVPCDMKCYQESKRNSYDFSFGINWQGVIRDASIFISAKEIQYRHW